MQTLGERLQEARQRLGVTLREAAEFTKIRTDYLQSMEANQFESIPLADVYKRGFVKVYAKYLRLDDEKAGADFNTHHSAKASRRPLEAAADEDAPFEPESGVSSITLSRDALIYVVIGIAVVAIVLALVFP
jgi:cytoskeletal protein RodZ